MIDSAELTRRVIWNYRNGAKAVFRNWYAPGWWETDVSIITKAHYWTEYEIKTSVADFNADALKSKYNGHNQPELRKHELLAGADKGPNRFYFVVPEDIADRIKLPPWAGLIVAHPHLRIEQQAPQRHKRKASFLFIERGLISTMWRYLDTTFKEESCSSPT